MEKLEKAFKNAKESETYQKEMEEFERESSASSPCSAFEAWWEDYVGEAFMVGGEGDREIAKAAWEASEKQQNDSGQPHQTGASDD